MFASLGVTVYGFYLHALSATAAGVTPPMPVHDTNAFGTGNLDAFLKQRVIFSQGLWVSRAEVIKYIANIKHGVHSSSGGKKDLDHVVGPLEYARRRARIRRDPTGINFDMADPVAGVFDPSDFKYGADTVDVVLLELLATVQLMLRSPDVQALDAYIRKELA
jgi:hypothetical protein